MIALVEVQLAAGTDPRQRAQPFQHTTNEMLVMPSQHSAAISYKMIKSMSRAKVIGPLLIGLGLPIEIAPLRSSTSELINLASVAAYSADIIDYKK